jgi:hypothetical protein
VGQQLRVTVAPPPRTRSRGRACDPRGWGESGVEVVRRCILRMCFATRSTPREHLCLNRQRCWHRHKKTTCAQLCRGLALYASAAGVEHGGLHNRCSTDRAFSRSHSVGLMKQGHAVRSAASRMATSIRRLVTSEPSTEIIARASPDGRQSGRQRSAPRPDRVGDVQRDDR